MSVDRFVREPTPRVAQAEPRVWPRPEGGPQLAAALDVIAEVAGGHADVAVLRRFSATGWTVLHQHGELVAALFCDAGGTSPNHWLDTLPAEPSIVLDDLPRGPIMDGWVPLSPPARSALVVRTSADRACGAVVVASRAPAAFRVVPAAATARIRALGDLALQVSLLQDRASGLERALGSSRSIGAAIGILMARHLMTVDAAFDRLSEVSQRTNRKLHDVAEDVMATGELPPVRQEVRQR